MPLRVTFHPNRVSLTPHRVTPNFEDQINKQFEQPQLNSLKNLRIRGNPFLLSKASKRRLQDRVTAMYRLSTPRTIRTQNNKLIYNFRCGFLTLTLPAKQVHSDVEIKEKALNQLMVELRKNYKVENYVWKAELQANENIHFHIVLDRYVDFYAIRRRWNRILDKLGYIEAYQERMNSQSFFDYYTNARKYNNNLSEAEAKIRYKKGLETNWANAPTVDIRVIKTEKDVAIYMSKYISKDIVEKDKEKYTEDEQRLLERGADFGRSWFCSRSLSRLNTAFSFDLNKVENILDVIENAEGSKFFMGDFFRVWYFRYNQLENTIQRFLRGWLMHNAYLAEYNIPT